MGLSRKHVEVAIAVVFDAATDKLLICRRRDDAVLAGYWEFPGGKCHYGEDAEACARREVEEETGLHVRTVKALERIEHDYPHASVCLNPFVCVMEAGELELRKEAEAKWIGPEDVMQYRFPEANEGLVKRVAKGWAHLVEGVG